MTEETSDMAIAAVHRAKSVIDQLAVRLKEAGARVQEVSQPSIEAAASAESASATKRAEAAVDTLGEKFGVFAMAVSHRVRRSAALAREEAEDILAEAQSLRGKPLS